MQSIRLILCFLIAAVTPASMVFAQSQDRDIGHCVANTQDTFACWNPAAGNQIPESLADYREFLPNLAGWDFRINLPYVRYKPVRSGFGSPIAMAGIVEDARPLYGTGDPPPFVDYGHRNNSIWLFRADGADGQIHFKILPSRVDSTGRPQNASSLVGDWIQTAPVGGRGFRRESIGVAVLGKGLGQTAVHLVARGHDQHLYFSKRDVGSAVVNDWPMPWQDLGVIAIAPPSLVSAGAKDVALAWVDPDRVIRVQLLRNGAWTAPIVAATQADPFQPRLVWDGTALNLVFSTSNQLRHAYWTEASNTFSTPTVVSNFLTVVQGQFDVVEFNKGLHIVVRTQTGNPPGSGLFYTQSKTPYGSPALWTIPSVISVQTAGQPRIGVLHDNLLVAAPGPSGSVAYARKDPNSVDNRITGLAMTDRWLDFGSVLDPLTAGAFSALELLPFNSDLYLTAQRSPGSGSAEGVIVNFGRAAMKDLFQNKWQMTLNYAEPAGNKGLFGGADEIRMVGDFNDDQRTDIVRFTQRAEAGIGPATTFVKLVQPDFVFGAETLWHPFFSLKGEIPLVGDFNGDMKDDIVTFVQKQQLYANGTPIGPAPVWVSLSNGASFNTSSIWHKFFSLTGEIPRVGDFNGDRKADIVTFVQKQQLYANGTPIGPAPVWVSLSNGARFATSRIWHTYFSLEGEIPLIGDFNGDGKDDIATFVGKLQTDVNGNPVGTAPVWVSLSDGTKFGPSSVWHPFFSLKGEFPMVSDVNMDGKDDIVTFLEGRGQGLQANNAYVAFSTGTRFQRSVMYATNQARAGDTPFVGNLTGGTLGNITGEPADMARPFPDLYIFEPRGMLRYASSLRMIPYPVGAPWERYRFLTEKGIGTASFPEWIYFTGPNHCLTPPFSFDLLGAAGVGGANFMRSSVRPGGGQGHILEEQGHSLFANCLRANADPFGLFASIYTVPMSQGGLDANNKPGCDPTFDDCRDPEHFFLQIFRKYRIAGDEFRKLILTHADPAVRQRRKAQYLWVKRNWYKGAEFKRGEQKDVSHFPNGVLCQPGECVIDRFTPPVGPGDAVIERVERSKQP